MLGPFIAFASPVMHYKRQLLDVDRPVPRANPSLDKVLSYFEDNDVRVVVRLNEELYDQKVFTDRGMQHVEMVSLMALGDRPEADRLVSASSLLTDRTPRPSSFGGLSSWQTRSSKGAKRSRSTVKPGWAALGCCECMVTQGGSDR